MEEQLQPAKNELSSLGLKDLFYKYVRFLPLYVISIALALFVAFVYLRYATLVYSTTGSLIIQDEKSGGGNNNDKLDELFGSNDKKNIQNEIEYIQSRQIMARVVKALDLNFTYLAKGNIKELNVYKACPFKIETFEIADSSAGFTLNLKFSNDHNFRVNGEDQLFTFGQLFKNRFGVFRLNRVLPFEPANEYNLTWLPTSSVAGGLLSSLVVAPKQNTGILILTMESTNAQLAADVVNELMHQYQEATKEDKNLTTKNRLDFIDREIDTVSKQLDMITGKRLAFIKANNIIDPATQSSNYFTRIEESQKEAKQQQLLLSSAYQIEGYMRQPNALPRCLLLLACKTLH
jgi:tyrosine-protein kinase Etk/Wzc